MNTCSTPLEVLVSSETMAWTTAAADYLFIQFVYFNFKSWAIAVDWIKFKIPGLIHKKKINNMCSLLVSPSTPSYNTRKKKQINPRNKACDFWIRWLDRFVLTCEDWRLRRKGVLNRHICIGASQSLACSASLPFAAGVRVSESVTNKVLWVFLYFFLSSIFISYPIFLKVFILALVYLHSIKVNAF